MTRHISPRTALLLVSAASSLSACTAILGGFDFEGPAAGGSSSTSGGAGGSTTSSMGGAGGATTSSMGGAGGTTTSSMGGAGGTTTSSTGTGGATGGTGGTGGAPTCAQGETQPCYTGPAGTEGKGICKAGLATCLPDGTGFGACAGDVHPDPAGEDCQKLGDEDCNDVACADPISGALFGDTSDQRVTGMAVDKDGNTILAGYFQGTLKLGALAVTSAGSNDFFVAKLDPAGAPLWLRRYGDGVDNGIVVKVASDAAGNVLIAGAVKGILDFGACGVKNNTGPSSNVLVAKLAPQGNCLWSKSFGGGTGLGQSARAISVDSQNNVLLAGRFDGSIDFGGGALTVKASGGYPDIFMTKLGADGGYLWAKVFTHTTQPDNTRAVGGIGADAAGNSFVTGSFSGSLGVGATTLTENKGSSVFLAKLDGAGNVSWANRYLGGSYGMSQAAALTVDTTGRVLISGYIGSNVDFGGGQLGLQGQQDGFLATFDNNGVHQWSQRFGDPGDVSGIPDTGTSIAVDAGGNVVLAGHALGAVKFGSGPELVAQGAEDVFLVKLTSAGAHVWSKLLGDDGKQFAAGVAVSPLNQSILLAGSAQGTIDFGGSPKTSAGGFDIFLATFQP